MCSIADLLQICLTEGRVEDTVQYGLGVRVVLVLEVGRQVDRLLSRLIDTDREVSPPVEGLEHQRLVDFSERVNRFS